MSRLERLEQPEAFKRGTGSPPLFGIVQGFLSASLYFALGVVVSNALGFTWIVLLAATLFFVLLVLSYMEGASLHQERGGATVLARYGFNELWSFVAGWAIMLDYLILIAITAFATTDYLAVFWSELAEGAPELIVSFAVIGYVAWVNVRGAGSRRWQRAALVVIADLAVQLLIVVLGLALLLEPEVLTDPAAIAGSPERRARAVRVHDRDRCVLGPGRLVGAGGRGRGFAPRAQAPVRRARGRRRAVHGHRDRRLLDPAADGRPLVRGADAGHRLGVRAGLAARAAALRDRDLRDRDPRDRMQRGDVRALAARLLARAEPPDPARSSAGCTRATARRWC